MFNYPSFSTAVASADASINAPAIDYPTNIVSYHLSPKITLETPQHISTHSSNEDDVEEVADNTVDKFVSENALETILKNPYPDFRHLGLIETVYNDAIMILHKIIGINALSLLTYKRVKGMISKKFKHGKMKPDMKIPLVIQYLFYVAVKRAMQLMFSSWRRDDLCLKRIMADEIISNDRTISAYMNGPTDPPEDTQLLPRFIRAVLVASKVVGLPGRRNRSCYVFLASQLEGSGKYYANGGARAKKVIIRHHVIDVITGNPRGIRIRQPAWAQQFVEDFGYPIDNEDGN